MKAVSGNNSEKMTNQLMKHEGLQVGDYLIPGEDFEYSLEVVRISKLDKQSWNYPGEYFHIVCNRWDISDDRKPVRKNKGRNHIRIIKKVNDGIYTDDIKEELKIYTDERQLMMF